MARNEDTEDEKPLDPAAERLRRKLVRLLFFSMGFLILSVMTVFGVIIYRTAGPGTPSYDGTPTRIDLPEGGELTAASLDGGEMLLTIRVGNETHLRLVSASTGATIREFVLRTTVPGR